jgi:hypothetical protein
VACGCDGLKVAGLCYFCCKVRAGLFSSNGYADTLSTEQQVFVGIYGPRARDGWSPADGLIRALDPDEAVDYERYRGLRYLVQIGGMTEVLSV